MVPPKFAFVNNNTLMVIKSKGKISKLFTPFNLHVLNETEHFKEISWVVVEEIRQHLQHILLHRVHQQLAVL